MSKRSTWPSSIACIMDKVWWRGKQADAAWACEGYGLLGQVHQDEELPAHIKQASCLFVFRLICKPVMGYPGDHSQRERHRLLHAPADGQELAYIRAPSSASQ